MNEYAPIQAAAFPSGHRRPRSKGDLRLGLLPIATLGPFIEYCEDRNLPLDVILARTGFPAQHLDDRQGYVSHVDAGRLVAGIATAANDRDIAFHAASFIRSSGMGDFSRLIFEAETVSGLIENFVRHLHLFETGTRSYIEHSATHALWCFELQDRRTPGADILEEFMLFQQLFVLRIALGGGWTPEKILLKRNELPANGIARQFAAVFSPAMARNGILLARETLTEPARRRVTWDDGERAALLKRLASNGPAENVLAALEQSLRHALPSREYSLHQMALRMNVSARSVQRFLADRGHTYSRIVDDLRRQWAMEMLSEPSLSVSEIAMELGYTNSANFSRAFSRMTGQCPRLFRHALENSRAQRHQTIPSQEPGSTVTDPEQCFGNGAR